ncbi:MAG TPA: family 15 carbohydrate-binding domain-containing protein, partial [Cellvibrio sp.]
MRYIQPILCLSLASLLLSACGGSSNSPSPNNPSSSSLSSSTPSSTAVSSSELSSTTSASVTPSSAAPSSVAQSSEAPSSAVASSAPAEPTRLTLDMSSGWRGNGTNNSGITYNSDGVVFAPTGDGVGAVTDVLKPIQLENA